MVEVVGDASKFKQATADATKSSKTFAAGFKGLAIGAGIGAFNLASDAVMGFVGSLGAADEKFKADQASAVLLKTALRNNIPQWNGNTSAIEKYAGAQTKAGFTADEVRTSIGQLIGITHDQQKAIELNNLAQDLARAKGLDLATATDIVTRAAQGNGKALKGLGIDIHGAKTAAELLDAAQKNVAGSADAWAKTSEGKAAVANAKMEAAWVKIGSVVDKVATLVLPLVADALTFVAGVIVKVSAVVGPLATKIANVLFPVLRTVITIASDIIGAIGDVIAFFGRVGGAIDRATKGMWDGLWGSFKSVINAIIGAWNGLRFTVPRVDVGPVHFGGFSLGTPNIPYLHSGGIVPGARGSDVLTMLQAGERVIPIGAGNAPVITVNIQNFTGSDAEIDRLTDRIALRLRLAGVN